MFRRTNICIVVAIAFTATTSICGAEKVRGSQKASLELFNQRILPIFQSPKPSSCVQCHLAAVDLKNYILPSYEKTFVSLRDQGLIDLDRPEKSKILTLIQMGDKDLDKGARMIHEKMRKAEYDAFAAWIGACSNDPTLRALPQLSVAELAKPEKPDAIIRHTRKSRVVDSFVRNVWSQRMRCFPCHTPSEVDPSNPKQKAAIKTLRKFETELSQEQCQRLRIFRETPEATMQYLIATSRQTPSGDLPMIDLEDPRNSLILMKPMSKLPKKRADGTFEKPSSRTPVTHMGGLKMHRDDQSYKSFVTWIQDYANVVGDRYASVQELPADNWYPSKLVLRVTFVPTDWPTGKPVQLFVHARDKQTQSWEAEPIAFTQGTVTPRRMVNGVLFLLAAERDTDKATKWDLKNNSLARGDYLIKAYVDSKNQLAEDPTLMLGEQDLYGQAQLKKARWREGFRQAESVAGKSFLQE